MAWFVTIHSAKEKNGVRVEVTRRTSDYRPRKSSNVRVVGKFREKLNANLVLLEIKERRLKSWEGEVLNDSTMYSFAKDVRGQRVFCDG